MTDVVRGRFAPTPSGALHIGSARTALVSALSAWSQGGRWLLRVEDLDRARTPPGATAAMLDDLHWLGLDWDEGPSADARFAPYLQSERTASYRAALDQLVATGMAFPCSCSRRDLESAPVAPHTQETVYPGTCRDRDDASVVAQAKALGRGVSYRFRSERVGAPITFVDGVRGAVTEDLARETGDFVLWRADGVPAYQLAVVVDDIAMAVTEVVRGDDLLPSTARQIALYRAFGATEPRWAHVPLVVQADGSRLAKRLGSLGIGVLRAREDDAATWRRALLASLGVESDGHEALRAVAARFVMEAVPRAPWVLPGA